MELEKKVNEELKNAMKTGDKLRTETLRSIRASIIEFNKSGADREMNEEDELKILNKQAKNRKDAIQLYKKGGRDELAEKEEAELKIIEEFTPKQLSEKELTDEIDGILKGIGAEDMKDFGKAMGATMKEFKGKADGSLVKEIIRKRLGGE